MKYSIIFLVTLVWLSSITNAQITFNNKLVSLNFKSQVGVETQIITDEDFNTQKDECKKSYYAEYLIEYFTLQSTNLDTMYRDFCGIKDHGTYNKYYNYLQSIKNKKPCEIYGEDIQNVLDFFISNYELECITDENGQFCYKYFKNLDESYLLENVNATDAQKIAIRRNYLVEQCNKGNMNQCEKLTLVSMAKINEIFPHDTQTFIMCVDNESPITYVTNTTIVGDNCIPFQYNVINKSLDNNELLKCKTFNDAIEVYNNYSEGNSLDASTTTKEASKATKIMINTSLLLIIFLFLLF